MGHAALTGSWPLGREDHIQALHVVAAAHLLDPDARPIKEEQVAFFELFADPAPEFEERALAVIDAGLARGVPERLVRRAPRLLQGYEVLFWDTLYEAVG